MRSRPTVRYSQRETVDFVIVGSGAAGGILAKQLSTRGHSVVVLEMGPRLDNKDFGHDEFAVLLNGSLGPKTPVTWRQSESEEARAGVGGVFRASLVGGSSVHFTANLWRLHEVDFNERSRLGAIPGANLADWPIGYADLEPYYTLVDWEMGVSGIPGPFDPPRSKPYPLPPLPVKSSGVLFERGCAKLGLHAQPTPMGILSRPFNGRNACQHCGFCLAFGCEYGAKSSSLAAMIPVAEATGKCEIRPQSYVRRVELDPQGRATGVTYFDGDKREQFQPARAVILSANGLETPKLLLMSTSSRFPNGLANSSGYVGKHLMFNGYTQTFGLFEQPLNEFKSVQDTRMCHDFYDSDPKRGFYGGGGIDARYGSYPIVFGLGGLPPDSPTWGSAYKRMLAQYYTRTMVSAGHTTSLPVETNRVTLDPTVKDDWGLPAVRVTYRDHDDDVKMMQFMIERSREILNAAGATRVWGPDASVQSGSAHFLGTCRMGKDPKTSVINPDHRTHDVGNLFLCDGSSLVTSGRGQPTMTIMALAFRAGERIANLAKRGEI